MNRHQGAALLVVLLILAVMMTLATNIASRFYLEWQRTTNLTRQEQAKWYAVGAESLMVKVLNQDIKDSPNRTHLGQYWASSDQVFPIEEAILTGQIHDAQACFNLNQINNGPSVAESGGSDALPYYADVFRNLLLQLSVNDYEARQITAALRDWIDADDTVSSGIGAEDAWYQSLRHPYLAANVAMQDVSELRLVRGITPTLFQKLRPLVCVLPVQDSTMKINVNTLKAAQAPLLSAMFLGAMSSEEALNLIDSRPKDGWENTSQFFELSAVKAANTGLKDQVQNLVSVVSSYFEARFSIEQDDIKQNFRILLKRKGDNKVVVIRRQYGGVQ